MKYLLGSRFLPGMRLNNKKSTLFGLPYRRLRYPDKNDGTEYGIKLVNLKIPWKDILLKNSTIRVWLNIWKI